MGKIDVNTLKKLDLKDKRVLMRVDFNVPLQDGQIRDDTRIVAALESIEYVRQRAKLLVLASHLGRPQGNEDELACSLQPVAVRLSELLACDVAFLRDYRQETVSQLVTLMPDSNLILLENLRFHQGEKENDPSFAARLGQGFDVYVNDAFGTLHRKHASVTGVVTHFAPETRGIGFLVEKEITALSKVVAQAESPFIFITGGAKVGDKIAVILNMLRYCHRVIIGGGMAYSFLRHQGYAVGKSLVDTRDDLVASIFRAARERNVEILLPLDHMAATDFSSQAEAVYIAGPAIENRDLMGLDIGEKTIAAWTRVLAEARTILWNGPVGVFEWENFALGTRAIAQACYDNVGMTVVGGGDSVAAVKDFGLTSGFDHISTGGGAALKYLEGEQLAGLSAIKGRQK